VIISIPPNCITSIKFSPPLSEDRKLLMENMPVGHLTKFVITYDKVWIFEYKNLGGNHTDITFKINFKRHTGAIKDFPVRS
jgi:monoamine oxidase